jgi:hypothetical protein
MNLEQCLLGKGRWAPLPDASPSWLGHCRGVQLARLGWLAEWRVWQFDSEITWPRPMVCECLADVERCGSLAS